MGLFDLPLMKTKVSRKVLVIYCPALARSIPALYLRSLGYEVILEEIRGCFEIEGMDVFSNIQQEYPTILDTTYLKKFEAIVIAVNAPLDTFIIPKVFVSKFREIVKVAEEEKGTPIRLVGMNHWLSNETQKEQAKIFEGFFIGQDSTIEDVHEYLGGWIN